MEWGEGSRETGGREEKEVGEKPEKKAERTSEKGCGRRGKGNMSFSFLSAPSVCHVPSRKHYGR